MTNPAGPAVLPIHGKKDEIVRAIRSSQVVIVAGETGSGKTTQLPLFCLEAGFGQQGTIGVTQPRRIAATSVASFVASQMSCPLGSLVGYKVRFTDRESPQTKIKFMTDGILLRELQADRLLRRYAVVIVDEVHERSLNIDFILGYMRWLLPRRPDLRLVLSSATIETALFAAAFGNAPVVTVSGRLFPVDILHQEPAAGENGEISFVNAAADAAQELLESSDSGDILVFMPTERDIHETRQLLEGRLGRACVVAPLFGRMPLSEQAAVFRIFDKRKIIVATNIAETSVTVPNVRFVVDTGLARIKQYDPAMGITRLPVGAVSQASARQRAGRCGRVRDGMCVRLYSEKDMLSRPEYTPPEILRSNLGQVILSMASLGLGSVEDFPFLQAPSRQAMSQGYRSLVELGALDESKKLTDMGRTMARFPVDPAVSRMLFEAHRQSCVPEILVIASALSVQDVRVRPADKKDLADAAHARFCDPLSDFLFYLKVWDACEWVRPGKQSLSKLKSFCRDHFFSFVRIREWKDVHDQLASIVGAKQTATVRTGTVTYEQIHRCIVAGFVSHVGRKNENGTYRIAKDRTAAVFPGSSLNKKKPDWIVSCELVETSRLYSRTCASINPLWLETVAPHLCKRRYSEPFFDAETGGVKAKETVSFFGLVVVAGRIVGYGRIHPAEANEV
ncbi:MAG TPA: ATP-dependent RNA helicase HrpA, partial [Chitinivibrionales bacterium]|nr:ATP-dependent RNA helicase HrpA [Chitinivibrionales bacterium]